MCSLKVGGGTTRLLYLLLAGPLTRRRSVVERLSLSISLAHKITTLLILLHLDPWLLLRSELETMEPDLDMDPPWSLCKTPPVPLRNPNRQYCEHDKPLPPLSNEAVDFEEELLPRPLFYRRMTRPKTVHDARVNHPPPTLSTYTVSSTVPPIPSSNIDDLSTAPLRLQLRRLAHHLLGDGH